jgi:CheY-like chemotaxis protein
VAEPAIIRVLVVEDEALIRMTLRFMLEDLGCEVVGETSYGEDVRMMCEEVSPEVVFMDIRLKGTMDGIQAAGQVNEAGNAAIVFMSAYDYAGRTQAGNLRNVVAFVGKPFLQEDIETVLPAVRKLRSTD